MTDLNQGWRLKFSIKPDSCLAPCLEGGGDGKETMTFQTTPYNHVRTFFFTQLAGRELLGVVAIDRLGNQFTTT